MKVCSKCKQEKPYKEFSKDKNSKSGRRSHCKSCIAVYRRTSEAPRVYNKNYRSDVKEWLLDYKKTLKCETCEESRYYVLDFHHKESSTKEFNISKAYKYSSKESIMKEIDKCQVLCSNCHRALHWLEKHPLIVPMKVNITPEYLWDEQ
jgi:hypothetical protein